MYVISAYYVTAYYTHNLPHFDSIGSLTMMYDLINIFHREGMWSAWSRAFTFGSWIQGIYAASFAPMLPRTPSALMTLNFGCLWIAQLALFDLGRRFGVSRLHAFTFGLLPLLPDALFGHDGSYQDMRRDASFFGLLLATYCLSLSYLRQPDLRRGILVGLMAGLTQWARGNALSYLVLVLTPATLWTTVRYVSGHRWAEWIKVMGLPLVIFSLLAIPFYWLSLPGILFKYLYNTPDLDTSRWVSLTHYVWTPLVLMAGERGRLFLIKLVALIIGVPVLVFAGVRCGELDWKPQFAFTTDRVWLWVGGGLVLLGVLGLISLIVGVSPIASYAPSFPVLIGVFSLLIGLSLATSFREGRFSVRLKRLMVIAGVLLFMFFNGVDKLRLSTYPRQTANVQTAQSLISVLRTLAANRRVTWMWDGNLNFWVINYYLAQAGEPMIPFYFPVSPDRLPSSALDETVESRLAEVKNMLITTDVLILSDTPNAYAGALGGNGFFNNYGYLIVPDILASPAFERVYEFESEGYHFVILKRKD